MKPSTLNQNIVLVCGLVCVVLGAVVGPLVSDVPVTTWIPVVIGLLLLGQWLLMRRAAAQRSDRSDG